MSAELAIVLSDYVGFQKMSAALSQRGIGAFHAPTLADLVRIEAAHFADFLIVDGSAGYCAGEDFVAVMHEGRGTPGIYRKAKDSWVPASRIESNALLAA